ncbi:MAG TPA: hypothetical protein VIO15_00825 [Bacteroidales bacterium]|mgnify:CR=1 FL=1
MIVEVYTGDTFEAVVNSQKELCAEVHIDSPIIESPVKSVNNQLPDVDGNININIPMPDLSWYQTITDNSLQTISKTIPGAINETNAIAKGRNKGYVFATVDALDAWLSIPDNVAQLNLGDNLYILAIDVPDFWWDGTQKRMLETQKVDLTGYVPTSRTVNNKPLSTNIVLTGVDIPETVQTLTDASTIVWDASLGLRAMVTIAGNRTLANISNPIIGKRYVILVKQDSTGSRTLNYGSNYKFPGGIAPVLSSSPNATDILEFEYLFGNIMLVNFISDVK